MTTLLDTLNRLASPRLLVLGDLILDRYTWGNAERISPEAPVPVLRADQEEVRLGGAASVAGLLHALEARPVLAGVIGNDPAGRTLERLLDESGIPHGAVICDPDRPTTLKERFMGRAAQRHPQQILRVDREDPRWLSPAFEERLSDMVLAEVRQADGLLISDYAKGICTPRLLARVITAARERQIPVLVDPARINDYRRYQGATLLTPNRFEIELAAGRTVRNPGDAVKAGRELCARCGVDAVLVKLDSEGLAFVPAGGEARLFPTRPRAVYDVTGAGDMVLAVAGLCRASGVSWNETAQLANIAAGREVEKLGVAPVSRYEIWAELAYAGPRSRHKIVSEAVAGQLAEAHRQEGKKIVFTNGCFDLLHAGHVACLEQAAELGDILIVAVNSDRTVRKLKGPRRPVVSQADRAALLAALACVDYVAVFDDDTPHAFLRKIRPDVLVKGGTYAPDEVVGKEIVESYGGRVCLAAKVEGLSTTALLTRVAARQLEQEQQL